MPRHPAELDWSISYTNHHGDTKCIVRAYQSPMRHEVNCFVSDCIKIDEVNISGAAIIQELEKKAYLWTTPPLPLTFDVVSADHRVLVPFVREEDKGKGKGKTASSVASSSDGKGKSQQGKGKGKKGKDKGDSSGASQTTQTAPSHIGTGQLSKDAAAWMAKQQASIQAAPSYNQSDWNKWPKKETKEDSWANWRPKQNAQKQEAPPDEIIGGFGAADDGWGWNEDYWGESFANYSY